MSWVEFEFGDIVDKIKGGGTPSKQNQEYWNGDIYWASVKDMEEGKYKLSSTQDTITQVGLENSASNLIPKDTLIIATRMGLGRAFINDVDLTINQDLKAIFPKLNIVETKFLLWWYVNNAKYIENLGNGATVKGIRLEHLKAIKINLPPLETQKRIASILSAYDDLIENNLKRIKLLEETAQNIYKEWFVNFRFPNYEHTEFDEESGLPVGWKKGKVADLCEVKSGYAFKSKDWQTEGNPVMKIKNITNNSVDITDCDYVDDEVAQNAEKFELFEGDVIIAMTGATVGKVGLIPKIDKRIYINQRVGLFRPFYEIENNVYLVFSFFMTDEAQKQILNFAGGAAQPNISSSQIGEVELNIGSVEVLKMFESKIQAIMVQVQTLYSQNQKLKEARDILLPRLMNRTIEV